MIIVEKAYNPTQTSVSKQTFSRFFSTFDMDKLGKIRGHHWKERLKISKSAKFESDLLKTNEDTAPQSGAKFQRNLYGGGHKNLPPAPPYKRL